MREGDRPDAALGRTYEADGALWLRSTDFGDDKDRVVVRSDGQPTYISGDLAYYLDKRERGFDRVFIMLGADHHGYIGRMMAMCAAFGDVPGENLEIFIGQMVNLVRDGEPLRMSKRAGTGVTMDDLVDAIGVDASRYALVRYSPTPRSTSTSSCGPAAPVTTRSTTCSTRTPGCPRSCATRPSSASPSTRARTTPPLLGHEREGDLLRALAEMPRVVAAGRRRCGSRTGSPATSRTPPPSSTSSTTTAGCCRMGDEEVGELHHARLVLVAATRVVVANGLRLLGVSAPERM